MAEYEENMAKMREFYKDIFEDFIKSNPKSWC